MSPPTVSGKYLSPFSITRDKSMRAHQTLSFEEVQYGGLTFLPEGQIALGLKALQPPFKGDETLQRVDIRNWVSRADQVVPPRKHRVLDNPPKECHNSHSPGCFVNKAIR
ncbi:hypothetical protein VTK26DRAFT_5562 [Humicola hyalothermophila]